MNQEPLLATATALAECLVCHPKDLRLEIAESARGFTITINGHRDDIGKLMGKACRNVKAIQAILAVITERDAKTVRVDIAEGWTGEKGDKRPALEGLITNFALRRLGVVCRHLFTKPFEIVISGTSMSTTLTARVKEPIRPEIEPNLQSVFKAFGGMNNHFLTIEVVPSNESGVA